MPIGVAIRGGRIFFTLLVKRDLPPPLKVPRREVGSHLSQASVTALMCCCWSLLCERVEQHPYDGHSGSYGTKRCELVPENDDARGDEEDALKRVRHRVRDGVNSVKTVEGHLTATSSTDSRRQAGKRRLSEGGRMD